MTAQAHAIHPPGDAPDIVLHDGCERCGEWASDPNGLDDEVLRALMKRAEIADVLTNAETYALLNIGRARLLARRVDAL